MQWKHVKLRTVLSLSVFASLITTLLGSQDAKMDHPKQTFTGYPPSVYMRPFIACPGDKPCSRTDKFSVDPIPKGCVLIVTNGDGKGADEVSSYEVFLNDELVLPAGQARGAQAPVKLLKENVLRVTLGGNPHSKILLLIAYDPRESK